MRNIILGATALAVAVAASTTAFAGEKVRVKQTTFYSYPVPSGEYSRPRDFSIVRLGELSKGASAFVKAHANTDEAQALIQSNPALADELRAHGVQLNNVLSAEKAFDGRTVIYLK